MQTFSLIGPAMEGAAGSVDGQSPTKSGDIRVKMSDIRVMSINHRMIRISGSQGAPAVIDLPAQLDALRITVGKVDALAALAEEAFDNTICTDADALQIDRMAHLIGAVAESAATAVAAVDRFRALVADQQPAPGGDHWDR
jgi:hypothetical protein